MPELPTDFTALKEHLRRMGYELTPYGVGLALLELASGYNAVEAASHIALTTLALDVRDAGTKTKRLGAFLPQALSLLEVLKDYKDQGMMRPTLWKNDAIAIWHISTNDEDQAEWVERVLSDPVASKGRLATKRID